MNSEEKIISAVKELFSGITFTAEPAGLYDPLRYMIRRKTASSVAVPDCIFIIQR